MSGIRNPTLDNELTNKKLIDDQLHKITVVRFNQVEDNYLKVSLRNNVYELTKYDETQITDTTVKKKSSYVSSTKMEFKL